MAWRAQTPRQHEDISTQLGRPTGASSAWQWERPVPAKIGLDTRSPYRQTHTERLPPSAVSFVGNPKALLVPVLSAALGLSSRRTGTSDLVQCRRARSLRPHEVGASIYTLSCMSPPSLRCRGRRLNQCYASTLTWCSETSAMRMSVIRAPCRVGSSSPARRATVAVRLKAQRRINCPGGQTHTSPGPLDSEAKGVTIA